MLQPYGSNCWNRERRQCGLGARDVLRLEAGLPLHGHEIDEQTTPVEAGLERFVRFDKDYVGARVLRRQNQEGTERRLIGLTVPGRSAPRQGYAILHQGENIGRITSGSYSPTLDTSIGMGYVLQGFASPGGTVDLDVRGRHHTGPDRTAAVLHQAQEETRKLNPDDRKYTKEHEWVKLDDADSQQALVGITDFAQEQLGDIVISNCRSRARTSRNWARWVR